MDKIYNIIHKKLRNEVFSREEEKAFDNWISLPTNHELFNHYKKVWSNSSSTISLLKPNVDQQWQKFKANNNIVVTSKSNIRSISKAVVSMAAMFTLIFAIGALVMFYTNKGKTYTSQANVIEVRLPDSTTIFLNKNSTLFVANDFNKLTRTVKLTGEALFDVEKNKAIPFIVEIDNNLNVKVLGTTFNLRTAGTGVESELRVIEGTVLFEKAEKSIVVEKLHEASFNKQTGNFSESKQLDKNLLAWHTKMFNFDNTPINEVMFSFERYFNKKIVFPQNSDNLRYSGTFSNPSEQEMAEVISLALGWSYSVNNSTLQFSSK